jgi:rubrerythrin
MFLMEAEAEWTCPGCGALFSVHRAKCLACGAPNGRYKIGGG